MTARIICARDSMR